MTKEIQKNLEPISIPERYIYEVVAGKPIYYKGWRKALIQEIETGKTQNMGSSTLQARIIAEILMLFGEQGLRNKYKFLTSEAGLHIGPNDNRCLDIAIFEKATYKDSHHYADFPPKIVIEVDIQADLSLLGNDEQTYYKKKTEDLLNFGVEKVLWIFTETKQVLEANKEKSTMHSFDTAVEVIDGCLLKVSELI